MRPTKLQTYMSMAEVAAQRSHDAETKVGSVLVNNRTGAVIATGFNGFVRGAPDELLPTTRPDKYEYILHSELNLISNCAANGISTQDTTVVCTMSPCKTCTRMLFNCGINKVIAKSLYKDFHEVLSMLDMRVTYSSSKEGYTVIYYNPI